MDQPKNINTKELLQKYERFQLNHQLVPQLVS
jgi:hypothetical protein